MLRQKIQNLVPILGLDRCAPARHLVDFAIPLRARDTLAGDDVRFVATNARLLQFFGEWWNLTLRQARRWSLDAGLHADPLHNIVEIPGGVPVFDQRLRRS